MIFEKTRRALAFNRGYRFAVEGGRAPTYRSLTLRGESVEGQWTAHQVSRVPIQSGFSPRWVPTYGDIEVYRGSWFLPGDMLFIGGPSFTDAQHRFWGTGPYFCGPEEPAPLPDGLEMRTTTLELDSEGLWVDRGD